MWKELVSNVNDNIGGFSRAIVDYVTAEVVLDDIMHLVKAYGEPEEIDVVNSYKEKYKHANIELGYADKTPLNLCIEAANNCPSLAEIGISYSVNTKNENVDFCYNERKGRLDMHHRGGQGRFDESYTISLEEVYAYHNVGTDTLNDMFHLIEDTIAQSAQNVISKMEADEKVASLALEFFKEDLSDQRTDNPYFVNINKELRAAHNGVMSENLTLAIQNNIELAKEHIAKEEQGKPNKDNPVLD